MAKENRRSGRCQGIVFWSYEQSAGCMRADDVSSVGASISARASSRLTRERRKRRATACAG